MAKKKTKAVLAWWFCAVPEPGQPPRLPHGDGREARVGETLTVKGEIVPCRNGLHASKRATDALAHAPGAFVCRVRVSGTIKEEGDKLCASERTVIWMADATNVLHRFAVEVARDALLAERKRGREPDPRSFAALEVKERWLNGLATTEELSAAKAAASAQNKRLESMLRALPKAGRKGKAA